ncbi:MAG: acetyltransferase [Bryobacteraceae bacterium]|nr:acetyltransferase [Bryobacteraceae bacterium]
MKERVVILGGGPQAREVIDVFEQAAIYRIAGIVANEPPEGGALYGHPYLGADAILPELLQQGVDHAFVAIGNNRARLDLMEKLRGMGFKLPNAISPRSYVSPHASLGQGVVIMHGVVVGVSVDLGDGVILNHRTAVAHDARLERGAHIAASIICGRTVIGEGTNVWPGSTVGLGVKVGKWATIGAGSLVMRDVEDGATVVGLPARKLKIVESGE